MAASSPQDRLRQIATAITGSGPAKEDPNFRNPHRPQFLPSLPKGLKVNHTPLNPVSFLLRSATIRPNRIAVQHPAKGVSWTYSEWSVGMLMVTTQIVSH